MNERDFDEFLDHVREAIDTEPHDARPDFAAVVARAHARAPECVPLSSVREAEALAPVLNLRAPESTGLSEAELDELLDDARAVVEQDVRVRRLAAIPAPPLPGPNRSRWLVATLMLAAVLAGLAVAVPTMLERFGRQSATPATLQSVFKARESGSERALPIPITPPQTRGEALIQPPLPTPPTPAPTSLPKPDPEPVLPSASRPSLEQRIARLDEVAQQLWAQGDLDGAQEAFWAIIELSGRGRHADLAYGDLFTLARQRGDQAAEQALWLEYLERFPSGRFADDARAGLCRRSSDADTCWAKYLEDFPDGLHRRAALRTLDIEP